jgi:hypothetical protein
LENYFLDLLIKRLILNSTSSKNVQKIHLRLLLSCSQFLDYWTFRKLKRVSDRSSPTNEKIDNENTENDGRENND